MFVCVENTTVIILLIANMVINKMFISRCRFVSKDNMEED